MSMLIAPNLLRQMMARYNISNAALLDGSTGYLSKTFASAGDQKKWSWSVWIFRDGSGSQEVLLNAKRASGANYSMTRFSSGDTFGFADGDYNGFTSSGLARDATGWTHYLFVNDTAQSVAADRQKVYVSNVDAPGTATTWPQNYNSGINGTEEHDIGRFAYNGTAFLDGYIAETHFIDGQALIPSDFGELNLTTGNWQAKNYTGTYGTNGFHLDFADNANLGADVSGNGNNWLVNGTVTQVTSTPTNTAATWNPLKPTSLTLTSGNTIAKGSATIWRGVASSLRIPTTGIWSVRITNAYSGGTNHNGIICVGGDQTTLSTTPYLNVGFVTYDTNSGNVALDGSADGSGASMLAENDYMDVVVNMDAGWVKFYKNGSLQVTSSALPTYTNYLEFQVFPYTGSPYFTDFKISTDHNGDAVYSGAKTLTTDNLPAITATNKNVDSHFKTVLWTGTGSAGHVIDTGFGQVDFVWGKDRTAASAHSVADTIRGINKQLYTNSVSAEVSQTVITDFTGSTFTLSNTSNTLNDAGNAYVAWCASLPNTKTSGWAGSPTITPSKEIYNTDLGMSIVTYTGNGVAGATIPHSLGKKPGMIIVKRLDTAAWWEVYHSSIGNTGALHLQNTDPTQTSTTFWNDTDPTTSVFSVGTNTDVNASGGTYVAYIFAPSDFIKIGSYTGNGSVDGPFVNTGLSLGFDVTKRSDAVASWMIRDSERSPYNPAPHVLWPNLSSAESNSSAWDVDQLATGKKLRNIQGEDNASGGTYVYMTIGQPNGPT